MSPLCPGKFDPVVIFVSAGRTGTKALAHYFNQVYDDVYAVHEPKPSYRIRFASNRYVLGKLQRERLEPRLRSLRAKTLLSIKERCYVESNPFLFGFIEVLGEVFEQPKVLHIVRDPRDYVRSTLNFGSLSGLKRLAVELVPNWVMKPRHWRQMGEAGWVAWQWREINEHLNRGANADGLSYHRVRFEDLFAKDGSGIDWLVDWMGLPDNPALLEAVQREKVNASKGTWFPKWEALDADIRERILSECGALMSEYGYQ